VIIRFLLRHTLPRRLVGLVVLGFCVLCALVLLPLARLAGRRAARLRACCG
jgi:multisubunit Na+/H+ antiporter MnhF subunit